MISIINIGPHTQDLGGERNYEVRINDKTICTFKHSRINGLSVCLLEAAKAVEKQKWKEFSEDIAGFSGKSEKYDADF